MKRTHQAGSAHVVIIVVLILALIAALGWIFYQNFIDKNTVKKDIQSGVVEKDKEAESNSDFGDVSQYHDFRADGKDTTGVGVASVSDVDKLVDIGSALKAYLVANAGKAMDGMTMKYTIDQLKGDYAAGTDNMTNAYLIWGPKDGTGAVTNIAGTQNEGFLCTDLQAAKVPSEIVGSRCIAEGKGLVDYKG